MIGRIALGAGAAAAAVAGVGWAIARRLTAPVGPRIFDLTVRGVEHAEPPTRAGALVDQPTTRAQGRHREVDGALDGAVAEMAHFGLHPAAPLALAVIVLELGASALVLSGRLVRGAVRLVRRLAGTYHHQVGTCAMGVTDESVVDPALRVRGVAATGILGVRAIRVSCDSRGP